jgi:hypothetical protein
MSRSNRRTRRTGRTRTRRRLRRVRRLIVLALAGAAASSVVRSRRERARLPEPAVPPTWPPLADPGPAPAALELADPGPAPAALEPGDPAPAALEPGDPAPAALEAGPAPGSGGGARPLVAAPTRSARATVHPDLVDRTTPPWVDAVDGACPITHPVKGNRTSGIYHLPGGRHYGRTVPDRCYRDPAAAEADGMRAPRR